MTQLSQRLIEVSAHIAARGPPTAFTGEVKTSMLKKVASGATSSYAIQLEPFISERQRGEDPLHQSAKGVTVLDERCVFAVKFTQVPPEQLLQFFIQNSTESMRTSL